MTPAPLLECRDVTLRVPGRTLCEGLSFAVRAGECWVLVGPNGAGKTTLLTTLAGLRAPASGTVLLDGEPVSLASGARARAAPRPRCRRTRSTRFRTPRSRSRSRDGIRTCRAGERESAHDVDAGACRAGRGRACTTQRTVTCRRSPAASDGGSRSRCSSRRIPAVMLLDEPTHHLDVAHEVRTLDLLAGAHAHRPRAS